ncbi:MAG: OmpH family outer membrane protein [Marinirhabdus sp.]
MKTKHLPLFVLLLFITGSALQAQRGARIGYIDMEYILESVPEYREASQQLDGKVQRWKQDIEKKTKEIDQMKLNLANERVLLTKELIDERQEEIQLKEDEMLKYQQDRFGPNGDLDIQRRRLVQPIQDQVFNIVQEIAENKKYDYVVDRSTDPSMLFAAERNDVSDQVLRSINRTAKREEAKTKREKKAIEKTDNLSVGEDKARTEREEKVIQKTKEREAIIAERKRVRDSTRAAKRAEFEARRQKLLDDRNRRKDSILNARKQRAAGNNGGDGGNK